MNCRKLAKIKLKIGAHFLKKEVRATNLFLFKYKCTLRCLKWPKGVYDISKKCWKWFKGEQVFYLVLRVCLIFLHAIPYFSTQYKFHSCPVNLKLWSTRDRALLHFNPDRCMMQFVDWAWMYGVASRKIIIFHKDTQFIQNIIT